MMGEEESKKILDKNNNHNKRVEEYQNNLNGNNKFWVQKIV